ncbi:MAG: carboxypeptidase regulatory-like domain-containing protein [Pedosphaera sp.]|nr:carboxypeptidase regulatory-like domain-containing protein [Pedosphaera sp.]
MRLRLFFIFLGILLSLFAVVASLQAALNTPLTVVLQGRQKATYTVNYTDGSKDEITMDLEIDLTFNPVEPVLTGGTYVSSQADVEGRINAIVTAVGITENGRTTVSFDKDINYKKSLGVPLRFDFSAVDGSVSFLAVDVADRDFVAADDLKPYRLEYTGRDHKSNVWVRLPSPFHYPEKYEVYDLTTTARLSGIKGELHGTVLSSGLRAPISGATVQLDATATSTTDANGVFHLAGLTTGSHQVRITKAGYDTLMMTTSVRPFGVSQAQFLLNPRNTLFSGSLSFIDQPRPILPGQKRSAKLTLKNTSESQLNGFVHADVFLSARQDNSITHQLASPSPLWVILAPGQTEVYDIPVELPSARQLGPNHAGLNHVLVRLQPLAIFPPIPTGEETYTCPPFWVGQVVNVLTHGFGNDLEIPFIGRITDPSFIGTWNRVAREFTELPVGQAHPMAGSVRNKVIVWNSSDGWVQGLAMLVVAEGCKQFDQELAADLAERASEIFMDKAHFRADQAAAEAKDKLLTEGFLHGVDETQMGYVVVHLIGHSRGAAVNARLARLLTADGFAINQYTALDGYSDDWPPPSEFLADIKIVEELSDPEARRYVLRRVNYRVQEGLFQEQAADLLFPVLDPFFRFLYAFLIGAGEYRSISPGLKETLKARLPDFRAPERSPELFENRTITGFGSSKAKDRSNHLNVVDLYLESPSRPERADRYIYDNFEGRTLGLWSMSAPATLSSLNSRRQLALNSIPNVTPRSESNFPQFRDGSIEEVGALADHIASMEFPQINDDVFRIGVALLHDPRQLLAARWSAGGELAVTRSETNHAVELRAGTNTFLGQWLTLSPAAASVDFDLSVVAAGSSNSLWVKFETNVLQQISLTNAGFSGRISVPLQNSSGPGEVSFQLKGPAATPAIIRLDNLAIVYAKPKIISIEAQPNGTIHLTIEGKAGSKYAVEVSANLINWNQAAILENQNGTIEFIENQTATTANRFYRVRVAQ